MRTRPPGEQGGVKGWPPCPSLLSSSVRTWRRSAGRALGQCVSVCGGEVSRSRGQETVSFQGASCGASQGPALGDQGRREEAAAFLGPQCPLVSGSQSAGSRLALQGPCHWTSVWRGSACLPGLASFPRPWEEGGQGEPWFGAQTRLGEVGRPGLDPTLQWLGEVGYCLSGPRLPHL